MEVVLLETVYELFTYSVPDSEINMNNDTNIKVIGRQTNDTFTVLLWTKNNDRIKAHCKPTICYNSFIKQAGSSVWVTFAENIAPRSYYVIHEFWS